MTANYFDYHKLTESPFYGVPLTENHLNNATEKLRLYIVNGGAQKGKYLTISEIENIGHFLKHGAYYKETSEA